MRIAKLLSTKARRKETFRYELEFFAKDVSTVYTKRIQLLLLGIIWIGIKTYDIFEPI